MQEKDLAGRYFNLSSGYSSDVLQRRSPKMLGDLQEIDYDRNVQKWRYDFYSMGHTPKMLHPIFPIIAPLKTLPPRTLQDHFSNWRRSFEDTVSNESCVLFFLWPFQTKEIVKMTDCCNKSGILLAYCFVSWLSYILCLETKMLHTYQHLAGQWLSLSRNPSVLYLLWHMECLLWKVSISSQLETYIKSAWD